MAEDDRDDDERAGAWPLRRGGRGGDAARQGRTAPVKVEGELDGCGLPALGAAVDGEMANAANASEAELDASSCMETEAVRTVAGRPGTKTWCSDKGCEGRGSRGTGGVAAAQEGS